MRIAPFVISAVITTGLVIALNKKWGPVPPLGKFLSPQQGFWQNAEATDHNFSADLKLSGLKGKVEVYFDDRLVPHILQITMKTFILPEDIYMLNSDCGRWNFKLLPQQVVLASISAMTPVLLIMTGRQEGWEWATLRKIL